MMYQVCCNINTAIWEFSTVNHEIEGDASVAGIFFETLETIQEVDVRE